MKLIGYWDAGQDSPENRDFPHPAALPKEADEAIREAVVKHLKAGVHVAAYMGWSNCRFCKIRNGTTELGDGVWAWPEGLAHYVQEHHVGLPKEFVAHVLTLPKIASGSTDTDLTFWKEWVKPHLSFEIKNRPPYVPVMDRLIAANAELIRDVVDEQWFKQSVRRFHEPSLVYSPKRPRRRRDGSP